MSYGTPPSEAEERAYRLERAALLAARQAAALGRCVLVYGGAVDRPARARDVDVGFWGASPQEAATLGRRWADAHGFGALPVETHPLQLDDGGVLGFRAYSDRQRHEVLLTEGGIRVRPSVQFPLDRAGEIRLALLDGGPCPPLPRMPPKAGEAGPVLVALSKGDGWTTRAVLGLPDGEADGWLAALVAASHELQQASPAETEELSAAIRALVARRCEQVERLNALLLQVSEDILFARDTKKTGACRRAGYM